MMKIFQPLIILLLLAIGTDAQQKLSLSDAIQTALENNYDLVIQQNDRLIAQEQNTWGAAGRYPYINLTGEARYNYNINETDNYLRNEYSGGAMVSWTLFDGFSVLFNKRRLDELENLSGENTALLVEGTIQSVILAYYSVLLEKEKLDVYREVMQLSDDLYKKASLQKEIGSAVTYDVLQAQNAYLADKSRFLLQQVNYKTALRDLNFLMAVTDGGELELTDKFEAMPVEYNLADLEEAMKANNRTLKSQYINQSLLKNAVALAKSDFYPTVSFNGGATATRTGFDYESSADAKWNNVNNYYGNFTLSFNLYGGGAKRRALKIAEINKESADVGLQQMTHELNNELHNVFGFYLVREELLDVARENIAAAKLNLQISREKYESGSINSFNFRDVQILYLNSAVAELEAVYNFIDVHTGLLRLTGGIVQQYSK